MRNLPRRVFTTAQIKFIEADYANSHNGHTYDLMEKAGLAVFKHILSVKPKPDEVWIFCGKGNNGGDGYIVASCLKERGLRHRVFAVGKPRQGTEASTACEYYLSLGGVIEERLPDEQVKKPDVIVDALLGTGISSSPRAPLDDWIYFINKCHAYTVAVDIPSGVCADTGHVPGDCINASATVCMLGLKPGLLTGDAVDYVGQLLFASLDVDTSTYSDEDLESLQGALPLPVFLSSYESSCEDLPKRAISSNKGDNGKVLIVGGSQGMGGAAIISGIGALRAGSGLVKVALDPINIPALNSVCPELMTVNYLDDEAIDSAIQWADVIALGPGLGQSSRVRELLNRAYASDKYIVCDADSLNIMAKDSPSYNERRIITPHPGEAGRLLGVSTEEVNADRLMAAYTLQQRYGGVVLLKGAGSVICNGKRFVIIDEGSPAMAVGGMGDLLTGIIASFLGQGLTFSQSVICGACVHGRAGFLAGEKEGPVGTFPSDLNYFVRRLVNGRS
ncbi:MAG: NAD(P)H-hydrate dehydratase [Succinivibrio sp.]|nr:NAD(P)H-hydrate dehydratase [Succinivibrio sp.]